MNTYKYINFNKGLLDDCIDTVYVKTLENSPRLQDVYNKLNQLKLCKINIIQINKKYTEFYNDKLIKQSSSYHLLYNNIEIFKHSLHYNNILVLEDDFLFTDSINDKNIINDLSYFINHNDFNLLYLGNLPILFSPSTNHKFHNILFNGQAHSIIYSKNSRDIIVNKYNIAIKNKYISFDLHDLWYNTFLDKKYFYYKPLCYQVIEKTENSKIWSNFFIDYCIDLLKLNNKTVKSYYNFYNFIYIIHFIIIIVIIILFTLLINYLNILIFK